MYVIGLEHLSESALELVLLVLLYLLKIEALTDVGLADCLVGVDRVEFEVSSLHISSGEYESDETKYEKRTKYRDD